MGKRKRPSKHALSQEEIWDDSALIRSWDEALAEYEFYHSIAARGEDVEEVLRLAELEEEGEAITNGNKGTKAVADGGEVQRTGNGEVSAEELEDGEVDEGGDVDLASNEDAGGGASKSRSRSIGPQLPPTKSTITSAEDQRKWRAPECLQNETGVVAETTEATAPGQDQILENIKMAYWWAGYYSGLYEGRQQVNGASTR